MYNNGVYTLNDISNRLYKNSSVGASARSINIEDVTSKVKSGFNYIESVSGYKAYGTKNTYGGGVDYPEMLKYLSTATVDGVTGNGIYNDNSKQSSSISNSYYTSSSSISVTTNYFHVNSNTKNNLIGVETQNSTNDTQFYSDILFDSSNLDGYLYATRLILCTEVDVIFGIYSGPSIMGNGVKVPNLPLQVNKGLRPIVTIPQDRIDLSVGNGVKGNEWGIK